MSLKFFLFILIAYFLGSIPFGLLIGKWVKGIDVRNFGSKNIGTTNVFRVVGKKWGVVVFLLDASKGYLAVKLPSFFMTLPVSTLIFLGVAAIIGHTFSIWLRFKGGKGVATSLGVFLGVSFFPTSIAFGIWVVVFAASHIVSVASLIAAVSFPFLLFIIARRQEGFPALISVSLILACFIFYTHRANLKRLLRGEEKRLF